MINVFGKLFLDKKALSDTDKLTHEIPLTNYLDAAFGKNIITGQTLTNLVTK
ncbi:hypothetical protein [Thermoanaerobacterium saccharolyticum]|uniref:hypothetical protein n=1 Tax=Thermoanaerobacterium saccharolyticum TaxID=28896 RepID=UPI003A4DD207